MNCSTCQPSIRYARIYCWVSLMYIRCSVFRAVTGQGANFPGFVWVTAIDSDVATESIAEVAFGCCY